MKANELRLGNYVMYNSMVMIVSEILSPKPRKDERYNNKYVIELFDGEGLIDATLEEISPIPLTEEWLLKLGYNNNIFKHIFEIGEFYFTKDEDSFFYNSSEIKYVHKTQNLYYALKEEELTIKN